MRNRTETQTHDDGDSPNEYPAGVLELIEAIRNWTRRTGVATHWRSDTVTLAAGVERPLASENKQRARMLIWTDASNTAPVWISATPINADPTGRDHNGAVALAPNSAQLELGHSGPVFAYSNAAAVVYVTNEYLA